MHAKKEFLTANPRIRSAYEIVGMPPSWHVIESDPPPSDTAVLLYSPNRHATNPERVESRIYRDSRGGSMHAWATHWMPLPEPPAAPAKPKRADWMRSAYEERYRTDWNDSSPLAQQERAIWQAAWEAATAQQTEGER